MCTEAQASIHELTHMRTHTHTHMHINVHAHIYIYIHAHTQRRRQVFMTVSYFVSGFSHIITMDLHQKEVQGFFHVPVDNLRASTFLVAYIQDSVSLSNSHLFPVFTFADICLHFWFRVLIFLSIDFEMVSFCVCLVFIECRE